MWQAHTFDPKYAIAKSGNFWLSRNDPDPEARVTEFFERGATKKDFQELKALPRPAMDDVALQHLHADLEKFCGVWEEMGTWEAGTTWVGEEGENRAKRLEFLESLKGACPKWGGDCSPEFLESMKGACPMWEGVISRFRWDANGNIQV